jgi:hypothetical protein
MTCFNENNADLLIAFFENTLTDAQRVEIEAHTAQCADCRGLLAAHRTMSEYAAPEVSSDFDSRLYARIRAEQARAWWHISNWKLVIPMTAVAAMFAIGVFLVESDRAPLDPPVTKADVKMDIDVQQLDQALDDLELLMPLPQANL